MTTPATFQGARPAPFRCVVVGLDDPPRPQDALAWARRIHAADGARVVLATVATSPLPEDLQASLDVEVARLSDRGIDADATTAIGSAPHELARIATIAAADLVIVGSHRGSPWDEALFGSTSSALRHHARERGLGAVLIARGAPEPRRLLVPTDGSPASNAALAHALRLADAWRATTRVLHVAEHLNARATELPDAEEAASSLGTIPAGQRASYELAFGDAAETILQRAKDADLVIIGARGHGALAGRLLGSVSDVVARRAPCSVLVVRSTG